MVLAGGGTAGHVEPAMAVADALTALDPDVRITALGTQRGLETRLVPERGYHLELITPVPLPRKPSGDLMRLPLRVRRAVRQTRAVLDDVDADVVIGFGGYVALPAYLAARGGLAWTGEAPPRSRRGPRGQRERGLGEPRRRAIGASACCRRCPIPGCAASRSSGCRCGRRSPRWTAWRFGPRRGHTSGSPTTQGCCWCSAARRAPSRINRAVAAAAKDLAVAGVSVLHAHGPKNTLDLREPADGDPPYVAVPYLDRMDLAYAAADLADLPVRCDDGRRGDGRRPARGLRAPADRQRRAAAQRAAGGQRRRRPHRRRRRPDPVLRRRHGHRPAQRRRPAAGDDGGRRACGAPGRRAARRRSRA